MQPEPLLPPKALRMQACPRHEHESLNALQILGITKDVMQEPQSRRAMHAGQRTSPLGNRDLAVGVPTCMTNTGSQASDPKFPRLGRRPHFGRAARAGRVLRNQVLVVWVPLVYKRCSSWTRSINKGLRSGGSATAASAVQPTRQVSNVSALQAEVPILSRFDLNRLHPVVGRPSVYSLLRRSFGPSMKRSSPAYPSRTAPFLAYARSARQDVVAS